MLSSGFSFFPENASTIAGEVDLIYFFLLAITVFFCVLVAGLIVYFAVKYHAHNRTVNRDGAPDSHLLLELTWTGIPLVLVMVVFVWGAKLFYKSRTPPQDAMQIHVVGKQWMWKIQHPDGPREINALHVPLGTPIKLRMISEDVVHNFSIPAFRVKQDVIPGSYTTLWFEATKLGRYRIFCDQYCGLLHSQMIGHVIVMTPAEYQAWLGKGWTLPAGAAGTGESGEAIWSRMGCGSCHMPTGEGRGPSLVGLYNKKVALTNGQTVIADDSYLRESILRSNAKIVAGYQPIMTAYQNQLTEENVIQLIEHIKGMK